MISYKPLMKKLIDKGIRKQELKDRAAISWSTMARLNTNQYVSLEVIDKICLVLDCQPGEIIECIKTSPGEE